MPYLIGIDEAGYGPNLGPLVITATVWRVESAADQTDLYDLLSGVITSAPNDRSGRLAIADSKALYKPRGPLGALERGVLAAAAVLDHRPDDWPQLCDALDPECRDQCDELPWQTDFHLSLPREMDREQLEGLTSKLQAGLSQSDVTLRAIHSTLVFPARFNRLVQDHGNKSTVLSTLSLRLLARALEGLDEPVLVICDKHGGRNRYGPLLQTQFPEPLIEVRDESRACSIYRWGPPEQRVETRFAVGGESFLPAALASMTCKYLRELSMRALNDFWVGHLPQLRPTAGYPVDARRFKDQIAAMQGKLGIDDRLLWRCR